MEKKSCSVCTIVTIVLGVLAALSAIGTAVYFIARHLRRRDCCGEYISFDDGCCCDSLEEADEDAEPDEAVSDETDGE